MKRIKIWRKIDKQKTSLKFQVKIIKDKLLGKSETLNRAQLMKENDSHESKVTQILINSKKLWDLKNSMSKLTSMTMVMT